MFLSKSQPCQISEPYDNPFWENSYGGERKRERRKERKKKQNIENSGLHNSKRQVKGGYKKVNKLYRRYTLLDVKHYWPSVFTLQNTQ